ncbi:MAG: undecaprenyl/decaprenyl-phosphate alpha-N-acetylglucosaminyl 1-phosphate transferase [Alphaproteobacteria bacterium]|nr:undecaprenyl/decaprenyl-phosphate alpha-N-acetylglucosaminyl 1-phosphate transferase [Alphaproteobacteria bacterium]
MAADAPCPGWDGGASPARELAASFSEPGPVSSSSLIVLTAISIVCALFVCLFRTPIARGMQLLDLPDKRKRHTSAVPMVAGLAAFPAVALACVEAVSRGANDDTVAILYSVHFGFFLIGYADDRIQIKPSRRLLLSLALFGALVLMSPGLMPPAFTFGGVAIVLSPGAVAFLAIIGACGALNAINMADGQNGLCCGLMLLWLGFLGVTLDPAYASTAVIVAGALAVALAFNLLSLVFLGDMGAYGLGAFILGLMLIGVGGGDIDHGQIVCALAVPVTDCVWLMIERRLHRRSPFEPDRQHLHHLLAGRMGGWQSLTLYLGVAAVGAGAAVAGGWACVAAILVQFLFVAAIRLYLPRGQEPAGAASSPDPLAAAPVPSPEPAA